MEEFFHEVQVNSGIDIQFRKMSQPSRYQGRQSSASSVGQEAIINAMTWPRTRITVLLMYNPSQLVETIKDNGTGGAVDLAPKGGLKPLQERPVQKAGRWHWGVKSWVTVQMILPNTETIENEENHDKPNQTYYCRRWNAHPYGFKNHAWGEWKCRSPALAERTQPLKPARSNPTRCGLDGYSHARE